MSRSEIVLTLQLTAEDYQDGFTLLYRRRRALWRILVVGALPFMVLLVGWIAGDLLTGGIVFLIVGVWTLWLFIMGTSFFSGVQARRVLRTTPALREPLHYRFDAEGLTIAVGDQPAGGLPWRLILGFSQDDKVLILYDSPMNIRVFPRRLVSPEEIAGIVAFAEAGGVPQR